MKTIDEVNLMDDVFMNLVASDPEVGEDFCRTFLSVLLQRKIGRVKVTSQCVLPGTGLGLRGVRLDVEVKELKDEQEALGEFANVYDIEPHTTDDADFPRMLRFRQAKIDSRLMQAGDNDFEHLPDLYVILISDFDAFGEGYMLYTIRNQCVEVPDAEYDDGLHFLYFNTTGKKGGSEAIRNMLEYMQNSRESAAVDTATKEVDRCVQNVRLDPAVRGKYMTFGDRIDREKRESYGEGHSDGQEEILIRLICKKLARGKTLAETASELEMEESEISGIYEVASTCGPDYDSEEVKKKLHCERS